MIDDFTPQSMHRPSNVVELGELIRRASAEGLALYPFGGSTMPNLGCTPTKPGLGIDMRAFDQVIDYPARDMTITVQSGITIAKLQEVLAAENQRLPIDVPQPEQATLGGAIAVNASGPRRYGFGTLRDYVIGISFVTDSGNEAKAGGRVVNNVAGDDPCQLPIRAPGTLRIVTQVHLKLKPIPEDRAQVVFLMRDDEISGLLQKIHESRTRPVCVQLLSGDRGGSVDTAHLLEVGFEDNRDAVAWQVETI